MASRSTWLALALALVLGPRPASAATITGGCMDDLFPGNLNCTANDIQIARATNIVITDPCNFPGDMVTFSATFEVRLTAQTRYDIGLYFATDGDPNHNGALTGTCSITSLPVTPDPPYVNIDSDICGDINSAHSPMMVNVSNLTAQCIDTDGDGNLNLPNCTSWRQPGANEVCTSPLQVFPGSPSKCRCDIGFNIAIPVPPATLAVTKTASPTSVDEPSGSVKFTVSIKNESLDPANTVTIDMLDDDVYGDLLDASNTNVTGNTCLGLDETVGPGETVMCMFNGLVSGNAGDDHTDTVTASGLDNRTPPNRVSGEDDATVTIEDVAAAITVDKTASPTEVLEPGSMVTFTVKITNTSGASTDPVTIDSLVDDTYGDLDGKGTCAVPQTIAAGAHYTCSFTAFVGGGAGDTHTDVVTAEGTDDEGNEVMGSDSATVTVDDVASTITLTKTAMPTSVNEPGGDVTFTFKVENKSPVDAVTIDTLTDTVYGNLDGKGTCDVTPAQTIPVGGSYTCSFTAFVAGNGNDTETNVATASGADDDGNPVSDSDDATVTINNVAPAATLTKSATMAVVTFEVVVSNGSSAEALSLTALSDDVFGNITASGHDGIVSTTCSVPQSIAVGASYTCSFDAKISTSPHTDTVTGTISDDDGGTIMRSDSASVSFQ